MHACHHRTGTKWFERVLGAVAVDFGLRFRQCEQRDLRPSTDIFMQNHSRVDIGQLPPYVGTHVIRDPRDVIVSGYFYHRWTWEKWTQIPQDEFGGLTYQGYLNSLDQHSGLLAEIRNTKAVREMVGWDYGNPNFLELKYEEIIRDEESAFSAIFEKYGFDESSIQRSVQIARQFSFANVTNRALGNVEEGNHLRSGRSGQWRDHFSEEHKAVFIDVFGDALVELGYETSNDW